MARPQASRAAHQAPTSALGRPGAPRAAAERPRPQAPPPPPPPGAAALSRRAALALPAGVLAAGAARRAGAFTPPPPGYRLHEDRLDGYSLLVPDDWVAIAGSGNDVFFRNPAAAEENAFVDVSSPSSSRYGSVRDLGPPAAAAARLADTYLAEFMSTRIGVRRAAEVEAAAERVGADGAVYYDVRVRARSFASRAQLAVSQGEVDAAVALEWDRAFLTVLGVAGGRLYQLRLQAPAAALAGPEAARLERVAASFRCYEV